MFGWKIIRRSLARAVVGFRVRPSRDPGRLVERRRTGRARGVPLRDEPSVRDSDLGFRCAEFRPGVVSASERERVRTED